MRTQFDELRLSEKNDYTVDNIDKKKQIVRIYRDENLIAKKITQGKKISYFGVKCFEDYL